MRSLQPFHLSQSLVPYVAALLPMSQRHYVGGTMRSLITCVTELLRMSQPYHLWHSLIAYVTALSPMPQPYYVGSDHAEHAHVLVRLVELVVFAVLEV